MDWLTFTSTVIGSLSWPVAFFATVYLLRGPIAKLVGLISRVKVSEVELEFDRQLTVAKEEASSEIPARSLTAEMVDEHLLRLAGISPRAAVMEAWRHVEAAALDAAQVFIGKDQCLNKIMTFHAISIIEKSGSVPERIVHLLHRLRSLRNEVAHASDFSLSTASAIEYCQISIQVVSYLQGLAGKPHAEP